MPEKPIFSVKETLPILVHEKRNKKLERDKLKLAEAAGEEGGKVAFEDLPSRIQKRIEKRNRKKKEERANKKTSKSLQFDFDKMTDEEIYVQYKTVWPEKDEANLREYVYYQRIIHDNKN